MITPDPKRRYTKLPEINPRKNSLRYHCKNNKIEKNDLTEVSSKNYWKRNLRFNSNEESKKIIMKYPIYLMQKDRVTQKLRYISDKINLIKELEQNYKIKFKSQDIKTFDSNKLKLKAIKFNNLRIQTQAAQKIGAWYKKIYVMNKIKKSFKIL